MTDDGRHMKEIRVGIANGETACNKKKLLSSRLDITFKKPINEDLCLEHNPVWSGSLDRRTLEGKFV